MRTPIVVIALGLLASPAPVMGQVAIRARSMTAVQEAHAIQPADLIRATVALRQAQGVLAATQVQQAGIQSSLGLLRGELALRQAQVNRLQPQEIQRATAALGRAEALVGALALSRFATTPSTAWAAQDPAEDRKSVV